MSDNYIEDTSDKLIGCLDAVQEEVDSLAGYSNTIKSISDSVNEATANILKNIEEIQTFAQNIQRISSKTNMLSLNASIEAARSGEAGKGFAVVAEQMRTLANDTKDSSNKILASLANFDADIAAMKANMEKQAKTQDAQSASTEKIAGEISNIEAITKEMVQKLK